MSLNNTGTASAVPAHAHLKRRCRRSLPGLRPAQAILVSLALVTAAGVLMFGLETVASQELPALRIDPNPAANEATHVERIENCFSAKTGDVFDVDLVIQGVEELLAWEIYIDYDPSLLEIVGRRVDLFQDANEGSDVFDVSDEVPGTQSPFRLAAADVSDPPTPDSGSGVLGRMTFRAKAPGLTTIAFSSIDIDGDGVIDRAPFLRNVAGDPIADLDGDTFFDGEATGAQIAVDEPCADTGFTIGDRSEGGESVATGVWIAAGVGAGLLMVLGAGGAMAWRRRDAGPGADS
ncbi:MAG: hypothetical protein IIA90_00400 [Chloroflexi bacterium]|nr:hypothetical protein [Chloroflexota bacterium]